MCGIVGDGEVIFIAFILADDADSFCSKFTSNGLDIAMLGVVDAIAAKEDVGVVG